MYTQYLFITIYSILLIPFGVVLVYVAYLKINEHGIYGLFKVWKPILVFVLLLSYEIYAQINRVDYIEEIESKLLLKEENLKKQKEIDERRDLSQRSYYVNYLNFRDSLERELQINHVFYNDMDSEFFELHKELSEVDENKFLDTLDLNSYREYYLSMSEKVERVFIDCNYGNNKVLYDIYVPFLDSVYNSLSKPNIFYIHTYEAEASQDSVIWHLRLNYETSLGKGVRIGKLNLLTKDLIIY